MNSSSKIFEKCETCKKKILFSGQCKCQNFYCEKHRFTHDCSFSFYQQNKDRLAKSNPKIVSTKLDKI